MIETNDYDSNDKFNKSFEDLDKPHNDKQRDINFHGKYSDVRKGDISLDLSEELRKDEIVSSFVILKQNKDTNLVVLTLNEEYNNKKFLLSIVDDWNKFINRTRRQLTQKKVEKNHIEHILDTLDNNYELILDFKDEHNDKTTDNDQENIFVNPYDDSTYVEISYEKWQNTLLAKRYSLKEIIDYLIPELWEPLEFALTIKFILNIKDCSLPFSGIILGPPSSFKTAVIELLRGYPNTFYTDSFSPKSFVSHNTAVSLEQLQKIDLLPKIQDKIFLSPELSPVFAKREEELNELLGIITRVLDGHGYESDSGAQGHRGYNKKMMFVWIGAAVEIPRKVHKLLGTLGPKIYFFRLKTYPKSEEYYLKQIQDENSNNGFKQKIDDIKKVLWDYLNWFDICPIAMKDSHGNIKVPWHNELNAYDDNSSKKPFGKSIDDQNAIRIIIRLSKLLAVLRGVVPTWETKDHQGSDYAYTFPTIEGPSRAIEQLKNLAKSHALTEGRNYITMEDTPLLIKVVLSTASKERVIIFDYLLQRNGLVETPDIEEHLMITKPTALRTMTEFMVLGIVKKIELGEGGGYDGSIVRQQLIQYKLDPTFDWFLSAEFKSLRDNFGKEHHKQLVNEKLGKEDDDHNVE
ncbi:MAG: hypothetical protein L0H53_09575 [Candidatus Nitrosocosmicus sp.]|nr:hypothetical protein [Candidatus Nitrosocosmicus sp.]MDN5868206.1 hypothetical protein [Candidatus Nitrosocosmicus sp.]